LARKQIVVTDLTRMDGFDVCLAGIETEAPHRCIRPELTSGSGRQTLHPDERWLRSGINEPVKLFSMLTFDAFDNHPDPPHTEDWGVSIRPPVVEPAIELPERRVLLESLKQPAIDELFGAPITWIRWEDGRRSGGWIEPGTGSASLGTLHVTLERLHVTRELNGQIRYRGYFRDEAGTRNRLSISDLSFRLWADSVRRSCEGSFDALNRVLQERFAQSEVWLRIGLARPHRFEESGRAACYLQITGIHTIPDYLEGAAWYDFRQGFA
jgi:putative nucleic acid modification protein with dual OB domain